VVDRHATGNVTARRKADEANDRHIPAPMPGVVTTVAIKAGESVAAGDILLTLEAMKMEAAIHAPRAGVVAELLVTPGHQVEAKDLLVILDGIAA
jgi:pyruvate carboxylase